MLGPSGNIGNIVDEGFRAQRWEYPHPHRLMKPSKILLQPGISPPDFGKWNSLLADWEGRRREILTILGVKVTPGSFQAKLFQAPSSDASWTCDDSYTNGPGSERCRASLGPALGRSLILRLDMLVGVRLLPVWPDYGGHEQGRS